VNEAISLTEARDRRNDILLSESINSRLDVLFSHSDVSPKEREQLEKLLRHYAKKAKPFTACVRDNMKRFGPGRTEKVCATVKDMIRGTHRWRNSEGVHASDEDAPEMTPEVERLLLSIPDDALDSLMMEVTS
jgi:hypothetical protein